MLATILECWFGGGFSCFFSWSAYEPLIYQRTAPFTEAYLQSVTMGLALNLWIQKDPSSSWSVAASREIPLAKAVYTYG